MRPIQSANSSTSSASAQVNRVKDLSKATLTTQTIPYIDKTQVEPEVLRAAQGMEAMFVDYMLKVMRATIPENEFALQSTATKIYQGMLDSEYANIASQSSSFGLADLIIAYLETRRYNRIRKQPGLPTTKTEQNPSTGGTHEGWESTRK